MEPDNDHTDTLTTMSIDGLYYLFSGVTEPMMPIPLVEKVRLRKLGTTDGI